MEPQRKLEASNEAGLYIAVLILVAGILWGGYYIEASFKTGFYVPVAAAVVILLVVILWCVSCIGRLNGENERQRRDFEELQQDLNILKRENERLDKGWMNGQTDRHPQNPRISYSE
ncbi:erythroid membrane-associated protein-like [Acipenser oxyrinchus oxyrinchus]|uniref:Erythroid membrane-associated protein-like n=1 Tax=Acipenser oxyrinchus oxyrinchus TaxID=40147 RepID=A0AAD8FSV2_ACIOX|nr:erythroid membrane-associated protein-like [Acipenser oxyrinchus oxyrinchus]